MLFASDLDRTLIYSPRMIEQSRERPRDLRIAEIKEGKAVTYITDEILRRMRRIAQEAMFVPVTTRTLEQYRRVSVIHEEFRPRYAVVCNGGTLLVNGRTDREWNEQVRNRVKAECLPLKDVARIFESEKPQRWAKLWRTADELFLYCVVRDGCAPPTGLQRFSEFLQENNWKTAFNGRKIYFIPRCVEKGSTVEHVARREGLNTVVAAGDSLLDLDMARVSDLFLSPAHGEIRLQGDEALGAAVRYTRSSGVAAALEILNAVLEFQKSSRNPPRSQYPKASISEPRKERKS